ncbi:MAG: extracellular solute-binding protein [Verrucomicrobia bacterium]|nr:extracellular solute-binding protein [Verrucomicrobiota bacterium]MCH8525929.1 extracellular solute-binding protein [Kiritimatiellia bacterium]
MKLFQSLRERLSDLPMGPAPLLVFGVAVVSAGLLFLAPAQRSGANLVFWTFSPDHHNAYLRVVPAFEEAHGVSADVLLVHGTAINQRLSSAFWARANVPDMVEVENTQSGQFFRGPIDQVGFRDLRPWLEASGMLDRIPENRLAPYTHQGRIFGIPHDVHPMMLAYRADLLDPLLEQAGLTIDDLDTWDAYIAFARDHVRPTGRYMLQLEDAAGYNFEPFLYQAGGDFFNADGEVIFDSDLVVETLMWWLPLVAGEDAIAVNFGSWGAPFFRGLEEGDYIMVVAPDWRTAGIERNLPQLSGKMRLMPLPAFGPGGRRTSTWGGTMLGITTATPDPDLAFAFAMHLYADLDILEEKFQTTNILPADRTAWSRPAFQAERPYWQGQRLGAEFAALADDIPVQTGHPFLQLAKDQVGNVVAASVSRWRRQGPEGMEDFVRERLHQAADYVRLQLRRMPDWEAGALPAFEEGQP